MHSKKEKEKILNEHKRSEEYFQEFIEKKFKFETISFIVFFTARLVEFCIRHLINADDFFNYVDAIKKINDKNKTGGSVTLGKIQKE